LHYAAGSINNTKRVELFIARGAKIDAKDNRGATPLYAAAERGCAEQIELLLGAGADFNVTVAEEKEDDKGFTLLHAAARNLKIDIVELFIAKGPEVNAKTAKAKTPLSWMKAKAGLSAWGINRRRQIAELLIKHGAEE